MASENLPLNRRLSDSSWRSTRFWRGERSVPRIIGGSWSPLIRSLKAISPRHSIDASSAGACASSTEMRPPRNVPRAATVCSMRRNCGSFLVFDGAVFT